MAESLKCILGWERTGTCGPRTKAGRSVAPRPPHGRGTHPACPQWLAAICALFALTLTALADDPTISVSAQQRYPWNGLVDLNFTITGTSGTKYDTSFTAKDMVGNTNIAMRTIRKADGTTAATKEQLLPGTYNWVWDAAADLPKDFKCDRVTVTGTADISPFPYSVKFNANGGTGTMSNESFTYGTAKALTANAFKRTGYTFQGWATSASGSKVYNDKQSVSNLTQTSGAVVNLYAVWKSALYMVIDLSSGASSSSYPVSYLDAVPSGGWGNTYKTTKLVLRRCNAGSFKMGNPTYGSYNVTLTKQFYIGVFEVTQKQYLSVMGTNPSEYTTGNTMPVTDVSYNVIRGSTNGKKWPSSSAVDSTSFMGKVRARTGLTFDLPTEAQWEYACRAGTTTKYYWGGSMNGDYEWYGGNTGNSGGKIHVVGTKKSNAWGLYDMSGNVSEWCLDWRADTLSGGTDPKGPSSGGDYAYRVIRGGSYLSLEDGCFSYGRSGNYPYYDFSTVGFRLAITLSN